MPEGRRVTVYVPDELYRQAREQLPADLSWSAVLAEGLRSRLECAHPTTVCTSCRVEVSPPVPTVDA